MSEYSTAVLNGKIDAMGIVLNHVLTTLTPLQAAEGAVHLLIERETVRSEDDGETPEEEIAVKEQLLGLYSELLSAVAKREQ